MIQKHRWIHRLRMRFRWVPLLQVCDGEDLCTIQHQACGIWPLNESVKPSGELPCPWIHRKVTTRISKINYIYKNIHKFCAFSENSRDLATRQNPENFRGTTLSFDSTNRYSIHNCLLWHPVYKHYCMVNYLCITSDLIIFSLSYLTLTIVTFFICM